MTGWAGCIGLADQPAGVGTVEGIGDAARKPAGDAGVAVTIDGAGAAVLANIGVIDHVTQVVERHLQEAMGVRVVEAGLRGCRP